MAFSAGMDLPGTLTNIDMSHNHIARITGLGKCFDLRVLNLSHNRIRTITGVEHLRELAELDVEKNDITSNLAVRALSFNRNLQVLKIEGNEITRDPGYRVTLQVLLPHLKKAASRSGKPGVRVTSPLSTSAARKGFASAMADMSTTTSGSVLSMQSKASPLSKRVNSRRVQEQNDLRRVESYKKLLAKKEKEALEAEIKTAHDRKFPHGIDVSNDPKYAKKIEMLAMPKYQNEKSRKARGPPPDFVFGHPAVPKNGKVPDRPRQQHLHGLTMIIPATVNDVNMHHTVDFDSSLQGRAASQACSPGVVSSVVTSGLRVNSTAPPRRIQPNSAPTL